MERRRLFERVEIVPVAGTVGRPAGGVEQGGRLVEPGVAPHQPEEGRCGGTAGRRLGQPVELGDELVPLGRLPLVERG